MKWLLIFLIPLMARAQITLQFQSLANMNVARGTIGSAGDNNFFYVANGFSATQNYTPLLEKYNIATDSWSVLSSSLIPKQYPSAVLIGSNLYIFNGLISAGQHNNKMEIVDVNTGAITFAPNNPSPTDQGGAAVWNGSIYMFGGYATNGYSKQLYRFDVANQTWTQLADMLQPMETAGTIVNGKLYTIGGYNGTSLNYIDMYDIATDTWSHAATLPYLLSANSTAAYGTRIYSAFDYTNQSYLGFYDVTSNTYISLQQAGMIGRRHAGAQVANGKLYIMGGNTGTTLASCLSSLQVADLSMLATSLPEKEKNLISLFPNPANDILTIEGAPDFRDLLITDVAGKIVRQEHLSNNSIDVNGLAPGLYVLKLINSSGEVRVEKFIRR